MFPFSSCHVMNVTAASGFFLKLLEQIRYTPYCDGLQEILPLYITVLAKHVCCWQLFQTDNMEAWQTAANTVKDRSDFPWEQAICHVMYMYILHKLYITSFY